MGKRFVKDFSIIIILVFFYNIYVLTLTGSWQYLNINKVIGYSVLGIGIAIPMYLVYLLTYRVFRSKILFLSVSILCWLSFPFWSYILIRQDSDLTYNIGGKPIYLDGKMTTFGYFYKLQSPFFFLVIMSIFILAAQALKFNNKKGE